MTTTITTQQEFNNYINSNEYDNDVCIKDAKLIIIDYEKLPKKNIDTNFEVEISKEGIEFEIKENAIYHYIASWKFINCHSIIFKNFYFTELKFNTKIAKFCLFKKCRACKISNECCDTDTIYIYADCELCSFYNYGIADVKQCKFSTIAAINLRLCHGLIENSLVMCKFQTYTIKNEMIKDIDETCRINVENGTYDAHYEVINKYKYALAYGIYSKDTIKIIDGSEEYEVNWAKVFK